MYYGTEEFKVSIPNDWDSKQDVEFVIDCIGKADEETLVEQLGANYTSMGDLLSNGIRFFLGQRDALHSECLDFMCVASKIEILGRLIRENPPGSGNLKRFEADLANCLTANSEHERICFKYAANTEKIWLSELQKSADILKTAEMFLDESLTCEYDDYPQHQRDPRSSSGPLD